MRNILLVLVVATHCKQTFAVTVSTPAPAPPLQCNATDSNTNPDFPLLTPQDFPPLRFPASSPTTDIRKRQGETTTATHKALSLGVNVVGSALELTRVGKIIWTPIHAIFGSFLSFDDYHTKDEILDKEIKEALKYQEVHEIRAKMDALTLATGRMLSPDVEITEALRKAEIPTVRAYSHEILQMLRNKESILWHLNVVVAPHLVDFAMLFGAIAQISVKLDPTQKASYDGDLVNLNQLLEDYEESVTPKRIAMLEYPLPYRDTGNTTYCGNAYTDSCIKDASETRISCAAAKADETLVQSFTKRFPLVDRIREKLNHEIRGQMVVYDPVSNFLVCGTKFGICMDDYQQVLKDQIHLVFEETRKFVAKSRQFE